MKKLAYLYLIVTFYQQAHQATPPIPPDYTSHHNYQLYDKLLSQNHPGMEFTATDRSEQSSCVFKPTHRTFVIV